PSLTAAFKDAGIEADIQNANGDTAKFGQLCDSMINEKVNVLMIVNLDSKSGSACLSKANAAGIISIDYDRLTLGGGASYYVSFDNVQVGKLQGETLVKKLKQDGKSGSIVMINGSPDDNNAKLFKQGAHSVLDNSGFKIGKEYDTPTWAPDKAQDEMDQAITALGKDGFVGVYAANDGTAGGAIAALKGAGIQPSTRPTTGQDAELAAVQRILTGEQYMTVYKAIRPEAEQAAELAVNLVNGNKSAADGLAKDKTNNGQKDVPSIILTPIATTKTNAKETVGKMISDGHIKVAQLCTGAVASMCSQLGLS
ncbi:MAG: sugar ABC transporter substrate-binding protein, partial [Actinomycetes bacterium]